MYTNMVPTRTRIFPHQHLGELHGWSGARNDCGGVLAKYGYTWSDMLYDYMKSKDDLGNPVKR
jgi:hypothetical protein